MSRDELARHLYIEIASERISEFRGEWPGASPAWTWDEGNAANDEVFDAYARADQMIANGEVAR